MVTIILCMFVCAGGLASLGAKHHERAVYDILAALFLIGALSLIGIELGRQLPL